MYSRQSDKIKFRLARNSVCCNKTKRSELKPAYEFLDCEPSDKLILKHEMNINIKSFLNIGEAASSKCDV